MSDPTVPQPDLEETEPPMGALYEMPTTELVGVDKNLRAAQEYFLEFDRIVESRLFHTDLGPQTISDAHPSANAFVYDKPDSDIAVLRHKIRDLAEEAVDPNNETRDFIIERYLERYIVEGLHDPVDLAEALIVERNYGCTGKAHTLVWRAVKLHLKPWTIPELEDTTDPDRIIEIVDTGMHKEIDWSEETRRFGSRIGAALSRLRDK